MLKFSNTDIHQDPHPYFRLMKDQNLLHQQGSPEPTLWLRPAVWSWMVTSFPPCYLQRRENKRKHLLGWPYHVKKLHHYKALCPSELIEPCPVTGLGPGADPKLHGTCHSWPSKPSADGLQQPQGWLDNISEYSTPTSLQSPPKEKIEFLTCIWSFHPCLEVVLL